jgi:hypothetical protein
VVLFCMIEDTRIYFKEKIFSIWGASQINCAVNQV